MHRTRTIDYAVVLSGEGEGEPPKADVPAKPRRARPEASLRPCRQWPRASKYRNAQEGRYDHNMVALAGHGPGALRGRACCSPYRPCPLVLNSRSRRRRDASRSRWATARRATLRAQFCSTVAPARRGCCSA